ncbi:MAG: Uma2 family endonuclease [Dehalococcoidia bacterium]
MTALKSPALLESGDRLSRAEFHRRFCLMPNVKKAELVEGVVYVPSPARYRVHGRPQRLMVLWLSTYALRNLGVEWAFDVTVFLSEDSEVMPDGLLFRVPPPPGGARETADDYIEGAPQLVVEISASTASYDLHDKLRAYQRAGVLEYLVWRVLDQQFDWFRLHEGEYQRVLPDVQGVIASEAFPGLRLHVAKLLAGEIAGVLAALDAPPTV